MNIQPIASNLIEIKETSLSKFSYEISLYNGVLRIIQWNLKDNTSKTLFKYEEVQE